MLMYTIILMLLIPLALTQLMALGRLMLFCYIKMPITTLLGTWGVFYFIL